MKKNENKQTLLEINYNKFLDIQSSRPDLLGKYVIVNSDGSIFAAEVCEDVFKKRTDDNAFHGMIGSVIGMIGSVINMINI